MGAYIFRRFLLLIPTVFLVSVIVFGILRIVPGDAIEMLVASANVPPEAVKEMRVQLGLDRPIYEQYVTWINRLFHGDLGTSIARTGERASVAALIGRSLPITLELGLMAMFFALSMAIPVGIISAVRSDTWIDYLVRSFAILGLAIPSFWIGTMVIVYPSIWWSYAPPLRYTSFQEAPLVNLKQFIVPAFLLGLVLAASTMRMTRAMMLEVMRQDYIRTAWAKGLRERAVIYRHALKNALIPVMTQIGLQVGIVIGGSAIIETIFNLPGMGRLMVSAVTARDYPVVQAVTLLTSLFVVAVNFVVDLLYGFLDPRIRYR